MCSNGQIPKTLLVLFFLLLNPILSHADEEQGGWIAMPGQLEDNYGDSVASEEEIKEKDTSAFISGQGDEFLGNKDTKDSPFLTGDTSQFVGGGKEYVGGANIQAPGIVNTKSFRTVKNEEILNRISGVWDSSFSVAYVQDTYDYKDRNGIFESVYRNGRESKNYGTLLLKFRERMASVFFYGVNLGFGFNKGNGFFIPDASGSIISSPEESNIEFKLYTVPLEVVLGLKMNLGSLLSLSLSGGPGVMGLWQHRDDREYQDDSKNIRQAGFGYCAEANLGINISRMSKQYGVDLFSAYQISNFSFDLFARNQSYSNFKQADLEISGLSFGVGLTFDYL
jgi:hypothetical protein